MTPDEENVYNKSMGDLASKLLGASRGHLHKPVRGSVDNVSQFSVFKYLCLWILFTLLNMGQGKSALEWLSHDNLELAFPWLRGLISKTKTYLLLGAY